MDPINLINFILSPAILVAVIYFFGYLIVKNAQGRYNKLNEIPERMHYLVTGIIFLLVIFCSITWFIIESSALFILPILLLILSTIILWRICQYKSKPPCFLESSIKSIVPSFLWDCLFSVTFRFSVSFAIYALFFAGVMVGVYAPLMEDHWYIPENDSFDKTKMAMISCILIIISFFVIESLLIFAVFGGNLLRIKPNEFPLIRIYLNDAVRNVIKSKKSYLEYPLVKDKNNEYILYDEETDSNIIINKSYVVQAIVSDQKKEEKTKIKNQKDKTKENKPEKPKRKKK